MKKILLDSNFLIDLIRFRIDFDVIEHLFEEPIKIFTLDLVIKELEKVSSSSAKDSKHARLALKLIESKKVGILKMEKGNVDDTIVALADESTVVATNDKLLRKKLKSLGRKAIYLRAKKQLDIN
jgi:rRNA-processing protein FCF1